jgi:hypothetical protein
LLNGRRAATHWASVTSRSALGEPDGRTRRDLYPGWSNLDFGRGRRWHRS